MSQKGTNLEVEAYADVDWVENPYSRSSTIGYFTLSGGTLVMWRSKKQKVVALFSAEAKFQGIV